MYFCFSDWEYLLSLRNVIHNFIDYLMETYGHNDINNQSSNEFRDYMCSVLCKLVENK